MYVLLTPVSPRPRAVVRGDVELVAARLLGDQAALAPASDAQGVFRF